jgi:hypothetical protein
MSAAISLFVFLSTIRRRKFCSCRVGAGELVVVHASGDAAQPRQDRLGDGGVEEGFAPSHGLEGGNLVAPPDLLQKVEPSCNPMGQRARVEHAGTRRWPPLAPRLRPLAR